MNPLSLTEAVHQYLRAEGVAVLEYDQIWSSLSTLKSTVTSLRSSKPLGQGEAGRIVSVQGLKIGKTDKVLIGTKTSWAIAKAIGEAGV
jgi:Xaa-Pro aminopeptidase